jgi:hypothetical protein
VSQWFTRKLVAPLVAAERARQAARLFARREQVAGDGGEILKIRDRASRGF